MNIKFSNKADTLYIYLYGEIDECSSNTAKELLDKIILDYINCKKFVFDFSGVTFMDSTGVGLLIGRYKKLKQNNISAYISGSSYPAEKVLQLSGLYTIMPKC